MVTEEEKKKIIIFPAQPIGCCYLPGPPKTDPGYQITLGAFRQVAVGSTRYINKDFVKYFPRYLSTLVK